MISSDMIRKVSNALIYFNEALEATGLEVVNSSYDGIRLIWNEGNGVVTLDIEEGKFGIREY